MSDVITVLDNIDGMSVSHCIYLTRYRGVPPHILKLLLEHEDYTVRQYALGAGLSQDMWLEAVRNTRDLFLMSCALGNMGIPLSMVEEYAFHENDQLVAGVAYRSDLSLELMVKLAAHPSEDVALGVANVKEKPLPVEAGILLTAGRKQKGLKSISLSIPKLPFSRFGFWLLEKGYPVEWDLNELPFSLMLEWLFDNQFSSKVGDYCNLVWQWREEDVKAFVTSETGVKGLPGAWVVKVFKTLVQAF